MGGIWGAIRDWYAEVSNPACWGNPLEQTEECFRAVPLLVGTLVALCCFTCCSASCCIQASYAREAAQKKQAAAEVVRKAKEEKQRAAAAVKKEAEDKKKKELADKKAAKKAEEDQKKAEAAAKKKEADEKKKKAEEQKKLQKAMKNAPMAKAESLRSRENLGESDGTASVQGQKKDKVPRGRVLSKNEATALLQASANQRVGDRPSDASASSRQGQDLLRQGSGALQVGLAPSGTSQASFNSTQQRQPATSPARPPSSSSFSQHTAQVQVGPSYPQALDRQPQALTQPAGSYAGRSPSINSGRSHGAQLQPYQQEAPRHVEMQALPSTPSQWSQQSAPPRGHQISAGPSAQTSPRGHSTRRPKRHERERKGSLPTPVVRHQGVNMQAGPSMQPEDDFVNTYSREMGYQGASPHQGGGVPHFNSQPPPQLPRATSAETRSRGGGRQHTRQARQARGPQPGAPVLIGIPDNIRPGQAFQFTHPITGETMQAEAPTNGTRIIQVR